MAFPTQFPLLHLTTKPFIDEDYEMREFGRDTRLLFSEERMEKNKEARMKIVAALGGDAAVRLIPIFTICHDCSMDLEKSATEANFPPGHAIAQAEDWFGRKVVSLLMQDRTTGETVIETLFQRRRETYIDLDGKYDGSCWFSKKLCPYFFKQIGDKKKLCPSILDPNVDAIAKELKLLVDGQHSQYILKV